MTDEKAIEVIRQNCYVSNLLDLDETVMINTALDRAIDALKRYQWIPITEKMPDVKYEVLLSFKDGSVFTGYLAPNKEWHDSGWEHEYKFDEVNAWMEIPDAYEEDTETEEERNRRLCRENYAAQMESLGYDADGNKK